MSLYGHAKDTVDIKDGIKIFRTTTGHVRMTDRDGVTWTLDNDDAINKMFYTIKDQPPEPPRRCSVEQAIKTQKAYEASKAKRVEEDKNTAVVKMADGTERRVRIDALQIPSK